MMPMAGETDLGTLKCPALSWARGRFYADTAGL